jgi:aryl-alcohol dehydrogenase-like predicted oxidoreductase
VGGRGWGPESAEFDRIATVERAVERGITWFDTAPTYGAGDSEVLLGRALKAHRQRVAVATKVGPRDDPRASLEASLRRLQSDYVDLVQLHEAQDRWEWQLEGLYSLQREGKAVAIGLCNATHLQIARALELAPVVSYQGPYNLFDRDVEQRELPLCRERGLAFLAYRPLAAGLLTGKYATPPSFAAGDHRHAIYWFRGAEFARREQVLARLRSMAAGRQVSPAALALAWLLARPGVSVVLAGARSVGQVDDNLTALAAPLSAADVTAIDTLVAQTFTPPRAGAEARALAPEWGARERHIVDCLDGSTSYETIAAAWTDRGGEPMVAAQVKVFVDQLTERGLVGPGHPPRDQR